MLIATITHKLRKERILVRINAISIMLNFRICRDNDKGLKTM